MGVSSLCIAVLLGLGASVYSAANGTALCKPPPRWSVGGEVPMWHSYGRVTVVALLQASCGFCLVQAQNMGPLRDKLADQGLTNISYMIVNDQSTLSGLLLPELKRRAAPGIPVYHQSPGQEDVWQLLDGNKDDFLIYDRCGRLTFHIRLPLSFLHFPYVEAAINATYYEDYCQNCSLYAAVSWNATIVPSKSEGEPTNRNDSRHGGHHGHTDEGHGKREHQHHPIGEEQKGSKPASVSKEGGASLHHRQRGARREKGRPPHQTDNDKEDDRKGKDHPHHPDNRAGSAGY